MREPRGSHAGATGELHGSGAGTTQGPCGSHAGATGEPHGSHAGTAAAQEPYGSHAGASQGAPGELSRMRPSALDA